MYKVSAKDINALRKATHGAGILACKKALIEAEGNVDEAMKILRKSGQKVMSARGDRESNEGAVFCATNSDATKGAIVLLAAETDFVVRNSMFRTMAQHIAQEAANNSIADKASLLSMKLENVISDKEGEQLTVEELLVDATGKIKEKITLKDYGLCEGPVVGCYVHTNNKVGSIVALSAADLAKGKQLVEDIAINLATNDCTVLRVEDITEEAKAAAAVEVDKRIESSDKPDHIKERMRASMLKTMFTNSAFCEQPYVLEPEKLFGTWLKEQDIKIEQFVRLTS